MNTPSYKDLMTQLKLRLKRLNFTYSDLARTINVPESTIKKWFASKDGSFNRISLICEALGIQLGALLKSIEDQNLLTLTFTSEQQSLFLDNKNAFNVYWYLVYERMNLSEISQVLSLTPHAMKTILLKLDKTRLLKLDVGDKLQVPKMRPVHWEFQGQFMKLLKEEWISGVLKNSSAKHESARFVLQFFQLSERSAKELFHDLKSLEEKFARRTILELGSANRKLQKVRYLSASAPDSFLS